MENVIHYRFDIKQSAENTIRIYVSILIRMVSVLYDYQINTNSNFSDERNGWCVL